MTTEQTQCDSCAFKLTEDQSTRVKDELIESKYQAIRGTKNAPKKSRNIFVGGDDNKTETCFIDSPTWDNRKENIHCPDRIDNALSLETALDLREARKANCTAINALSIALNARNWAIAAAIIAIITAIIAATAIVAPYVIGPPK